MDKVENMPIFNWRRTLKKKLLRSFPTVNEEVLVLLQKHIKEEFENLDYNNKQQLQHFYETSSYFYFYFYWKMKWNRDTRMSTTCIILLYYLTHTALLLSEHDSKCLNKVVFALNSYQGDIDNIFDVLLLVKNMKKKYLPAYREILNSILSKDYMKDSPNHLSYIKMLLLHRRYNFLSVNGEENSITRCILRIKPPPNAKDFLSSFRLDCNNIINKKIPRSIMNRMLKALLKNKYNIMQRKKNTKMVTSKKPKFKRIVFESSCEDEDILKIGNKQEISDSSTDERKSISRNKTSKINCLLNESTRDGEATLNSKMLKKKYVPKEFLESNSSDLKNEIFITDDLKQKKGISKDESKNEEINLKLNIDSVPQNKTVKCLRDEGDVCKNMFVQSNCVPQISIKESIYNEETHLKSSNNICDQDCATLSLPKHSESDVIKSYKGKILESNTDSEYSVSDSPEKLFTPKNSKSDYCKAVNRRKRKSKNCIAESSSIYNLHVNSNNSELPVKVISTSNPNVNQCVLKYSLSVITDVNSCSELHSLKNNVKECRVVLYNCLADHSPFKLHLESGFENQIVLPENIQQNLNKICIVPLNSNVDLCDIQIQKIPNTSRIEKSVHSVMENGETMPSHRQRKRTTALDSDCDETDTTHAKNAFSNSSRHSSRSFCDLASSPEPSQSRLENSKKRLTRFKQKESNSSFESKQSEGLSELSVLEHNSNNSSRNTSDALKDSYQNINPESFIEFSAAEDDPVGDEEEYHVEEDSDADSFVVPDDHVSSGESSSVNSENESNSLNNSSPVPNKKLRRSQKLLSSSEDEAPDELMNLESNCQASKGVLESHFLKKCSTPIPRKSVCAEQDFNNSVCLLQDSLDNKIKTFHKADSNLEDNYPPNELLPDQEVVNDDSDEYNSKSVVLSSSLNVCTSPLKRSNTCSQKRKRASKGSNSNKIATPKNVSTNERQRKTRLFPEHYKCSETSSFGESSEVSDSCSATSKNPNFNSEQPLTSNVPVQEHTPSTTAERAESKVQNSIRNSFPHSPLKQTQNLSLILNAEENVSDNEESEKLFSINTYHQSPSTEESNTSQDDKKTTKYAFEPALKGSAGSQSHLVSVDETVNPQKKATLSTATNAEVLPGASESIDLIESNETLHALPLDSLDMQLLHSVLNKLENDTDSITTESFLHNFSDSPFQHDVAEEYSNVTENSNSHSNKRIKLANTAVHKDELVSIASNQKCNSSDSINLDSVCIEMDFSACAPQLQKHVQEFRVEGADCSSANSDTECKHSNLDTSMELFQSEECSNSSEYLAQPDTTLDAQLRKLGFEKIPLPTLKSAQNSDVSDCFSKKLNCENLSSKQKENSEHSSPSNDNENLLFLYNVDKSCKICTLPEILNEDVKVISNDGAVAFNFNRYPLVMLKKCDNQMAKLEDGKEHSEKNSSSKRRSAKSSSKVTNTHQNTTGYSLRPRKKMQDTRKKM